MAAGGDSLKSSARHIQARDRLILAVDTSSIDEARRYLNELHEFVGVFKIGLQLFTRYGPEILKLFHSAGARVFLDCKFLDIPNTVFRAAGEATAHGVEMFSVHACGGRDMLKAAADAVQETATKSGTSQPVILAVTVLTSISPQVLESELKVSGELEDYVLHLAGLARASGATGLVASPEEAVRLRREFGNDMLIVTPGVRPEWSDPDDQSRRTTPYRAIRNGADYLVVGRPITKAKAPQDAARRIAAEIEEALSDE